MASLSTGWPRRWAATSATWLMVRAACCPPITPVEAFGQEKRKSGS
jgi:hypothetical protein